MPTSIRRMAGVLSALAALSQLAPVRAQDPGLTAFGRQLGSHLHAHIESAPLAILPLGAIEYHGPSGPPLTDSLIAEGLASGLASALKASRFPVVSYTHCPAHTASFRGSISVRPEVITLLLTDVIGGILDNGFEKVLILNAHNGNVGPAQAALSRVAAERPKSQLLLVNWWETLPSSEVDRLGLFTSGNGGHGHGGPLELSVAAHFAPRTVRAGEGPDLPTLQPQASFPYYLEKSDRARWPGYSGKLSEIAADKGRRLAGMAEQRILDLVRAWLADDGKPGSW
ncbi:MAG: creatininase family protein [Acidobacteriota bacterium]